MIRVGVLGLVAELVVFAVGHFAPAMQTLLPPVYVLVAVLFVAALWHRYRRRPGRERRHGGGDRRHGDRREP